MTRALVGRQKDPVEEKTSQNLAAARVSLDTADPFIDVLCVLCSARSRRSLKWPSRRLTDEISLF